MVIILIFSFYNLENISIYFECIINYLLTGNNLFYNVNGFGFSSIKEGVSNIIDIYISKSSPTSRGISRPAQISAPIRVGPNNLPAIMINSPSSSSSFEDSFIEDISNSIIKKKNFDHQVTIEDTIIKNKDAYLQVPSSPSLSSSVLTPSTVSPVIRRNYDSIEPVNRPSINTLPSSLSRDLGTPVRCRECDGIQ